MDSGWHPESMRAFFRWFFTNSLLKMEIYQSHEGAFLSIIQTPRHRLANSILSMFLEASRRVFLPYCLSHCQISLKYEELFLWMERILVTLSLCNDNLHSNLRWNVMQNRSGGSAIFLIGLSHLSTVCQAS